MANVKEGSAHSPSWNNGNGNGERDPFPGVVPVGLYHKPTSRLLRMGSGLLMKQGGLVATATSLLIDYDAPTDVAGEKHHHHLQHHQHDTPTTTSTTSTTTTAATTTTTTDNNNNKSHASDTPKLPKPFHGVTPAEVVILVGTPKNGAVSEDLARGASEWAFVAESMMCDRLLATHEHEEDVQLQVVKEEGEGGVGLGLGRPGQLGRHGSFGSSRSSSSGSASGLGLGGLPAPFHVSHVDVLRITHVLSHPVVVGLPRFELSDVIDLTTQLGTHLDGGMAGVLPRTVSLQRTSSGRAMTPRDVISKAQFPFEHPPVPVRHPCADTHTTGVNAKGTAGGAVALAGAPVPAAAILGTHGGGGGGGGGGGEMEEEEDDGDDDDDDDELSKRHSAAYTPPHLGTMGSSSSSSSSTPATVLKAECLLLNAPPPSLLNSVGGAGSGNGLGGGGGGSGQGAASAARRYTTSAPTVVDSTKEAVKEKDVVRIVGWEGGDDNVETGGGASSLQNGLGKIVKVAVHEGIALAETDMSLQHGNLGEILLGAPVMNTKGHYIGVIAKETPNRDTGSLKLTLALFGRCDTGVLSGECILMQPPPLVSYPSPPVGALHNTSMPPPPSPPPLSLHAAAK